MIHLWLVFAEMMLKGPASTNISEGFWTSHMKSKHLFSLGGWVQAAQRAEELAAYKVRAYALLQKKEAELSAAQDSELVAAKEAALQVGQSKSWLLYAVTIL